MLSYANIAIPLLVLLPNLLWMMFPPADAPTQQRVSSKAWAALEGLEQLGRIGSFALPFFFRVHLETTAQQVALVVMAVALLIYYVGWTRYFISGRRYETLFAPLGFLPLPLAVSPVVYFLASAALFKSWLMLLAASALAVGHLTVTQRDYQRTIN